MFCPRCHRTFGGEESNCTFDGEALVSARRIEFVKARKTRHMGAILGGRYAIQGFLGQGATARVYLAEDTKTGEPVAIKVLEPPWNHDRVAQERFSKAAVEAKAVVHPNVVRIHAVAARGDGTPYVVMEHLFGETLAEYLERHGTMDTEIGLPILREASVALEAVHEAGIVHRDVKPENIFLVGEPDDPYAVKLLDAGFARLRDATVTVTGAVVGTATAMAPEQCVADAVDTRTDVFGLGIVMYRAFTGQAPLSADSPEDQLAKNLIAPARPPRTITPDIDPGLEAVIEKCLRKDPEFRYARIADLRGDLEALASDTQPEAAREDAPPGEVYIPRTQFARLVAKALYRRLGVPAPAFLS
jgi:serine/threonine-protein kinase